MINFFLPVILLILTPLSFAIESEKEIISLNRTYLAIGDRTTPIKLELGFKHRLFENGKLFIGYHQKSFWDINNGSSPVLDSNYNPHIFYELRDYKKINLTLGIFEHLSNGATGTRSRGTNMSFIHGYKTFPTNMVNLDIGLKAFISYKKDNGSPDLDEYMGTWSLMMRFRQFLPLLNYHAFEYRTNAGGKYGTKFNYGSSEFGFYFQPTADAHFNIYAQYFMGRNEYLLDYKTYHRSSRIGMSLGF